MQIKDSSLESYINKYNSLKESRDKIKKEFSESKQPITTLLAEYEKKVKLEKSVNFLALQIQQGQKMVLDDDLKSMKRAMRRLSLLNKDDIVEMKGWVAGQISACDEVLLTELIFSGFFNDLSPSEVAAVMTCLVHDESGADNAKYTMKNDRLNSAFMELKEAAKKLCTVFIDCKINVEEETYLSSFKPQ